MAATPQKQITTVDQLAHDWLPDLLNYDTPILFGMTLNELVVAFLPGLITMFLVNLVVGALLLGVMVFMVRKFEAFGDRAFYLFLSARIRFAMRGKQIVTMPLIMPPGSESVTMLTWEGEVTMRLGGDESDLQKSDLLLVGDEEKIEAALEVKTL